MSLYLHKARGNKVSNLAFWWDVVPLSCKDNCYQFIVESEAALAYVILFWCEVKNGWAFGYK